MYVWLLHHSYLIFYFQKFTDTEELYLHHRNIYDSIIRERIANFPLDLGFIVFVVLIEMKASVGRGSLRLRFLDYFTTLGVGNARNYSTLSFHPMYTLHPMVTGTLSRSCCMLLGDFFTDPVRGGNYVIDSPKYALVAKFLLDCFIEPCPERKFLEQVVFVFYIINGMLMRLIQAFQQLRSLATFQWD